MKKKLQPADPLSQQLYVNFQRIFRFINFGGSVKGRKPSITWTQMRVLSFFNEREVVHVSAISSLLNMSLQSVNNLIHRLELQGYVTKAKNQRDKRLSDITLTSKGRERFKAFRSEHLQRVARILEELNPSEKKVLNATIENATLLLEKAVLRAAENTETKKG